MNMVTLGSTGIVVSEMCVGTLIYGKLQANVSVEHGAAAIKRALELGANFIDTAQAYGAYPHVAHAIRGAKDVVISSKSRASSYEDMEKAIYECRRALRREVIDVFHLHLIENEQDLNSRSWALKCILDFKEAGAVRAAGASVHSNAGLRAVADCPEIDVVMPCINQKGLGIIGGSIDECVELVRLCRQRGKAVMGMKPLGGGHLRANAAEAITWVRKLGVVDSVAIGALTPEEVEMNALVFNDQPIPPELASRVSTEKKRLIIYDSCQACGRCVENCAQKALSQTKGKKPIVDESVCILCGYCGGVCPKFAIRII